MREVDAAAPDPVHLEVASPPPAERSCDAMRIGILTGGGDCPGLNAVLRAAVRSAYQHGDEIIGFRDGWGGVLDDAAVPLGLDRIAGILPRGGTILGTVAPERPRAPRRRRPALPRPRARRDDRDRRQRHPLRGERALVGAPHRRRAEDDRQRPLRHRPHLRLRHRRADRVRCDRPPPHHRREPLPHRRRRGDGRNARVDRAARRARGWCRRDPRARAPVRPR